MENASGLADGKAPAVGRMAPTGQHVTDTRNRYYSLYFCHILYSLWAKTIANFISVWGKTTIDWGKFYIYHDTSIM